LNPHKLRFSLPDNLSEKSEVDSLKNPLSPQNSLQDPTPEDEIIMFTAKSRVHTPIPELKEESSDTNTKCSSCTPATSRTITETILPWKREDDCVGEDCVQRQKEFPPWIDNKAYHLYTSPPNTFLKKLRPTEEKKSQDIFSIFELRTKLKEKSDDNSCETASLNSVCDENEKIDEENEEDVEYSEENEESDDNTSDPTNHNSVHNETVKEVDQEKFVDHGPRPYIIDYR
ncbi:uncharacterized protein LOC106477217, partial [Limulus polyphemus]|uniref:Uncharacterized protein LOC106477217 n=1 Tax=Limulus polyphemus TaxID=6850 RepID=A0ABM1C2Y0_LIMPO